MADVLVIDDDSHIRQVIQLALEDDGHTVESAVDGRTALAQIDRRHPDVILLDIRMPGMDGREFVRRYRERHGHRAPIIALTASQDAVANGVSIGADDYLAKPFDLDALAARVTTHTPPHRR